MSFTITLRQGPARLAPQFAKTSTTSSIATRAFHQSARRQNAFFSSKNPLLTSSTARAGAKSSTSTSLASRLVTKRGYQYQAGPAPDSGSKMRKLFVGGAIFGGSIVALNAVFNRETREDGGMPLFEREYLNGTFLHTGLGIGIIALTARQMIQSGFAFRIMTANPWAVAIGGLALSFGTMIGTRSIDPDK